MKVKDLIAALAGLDPEAEVYAEGEGGARCSLVLLNPGARPTDFRIVAGDNLEGQQ